MTDNEILILTFVSNIMTQIWSYYSGFVFFGVSLTSILSAMLAISIILPFLYQFTSNSASLLVNSTSRGIKATTIRHENKMREQEREARRANRKR